MGPEPAARGEVRVCSVVRARGRYCTTGVKAPAHADETRAQTQRRVRVHSALKARGGLQ